MMRSCLIATLLALFAVDANAQAPTTVQLPSFSYFTYNGTVLVPDRGATYLGGVNRSATGLNRRGLSRGLGSSMSKSSAVAHAHIIDHDEIDRQLLGGSKKEFMARMRAKEASKKNPRAIDPDTEGKALVRLARKQFREGRETASFDTYLMAMQVLSPNLRDLAKAEFKRVFGSAADQVLRMGNLVSR